MKGDTRDKWSMLVDDQPVLATAKHEVNNTYEVDTFFENQTSLVAESLDEDAIDKNLFTRNEETKE